MVSSLTQMEKAAQLEWNDYYRMMTEERDHTPDLTVKSDVHDLGAWIVGPDIRDYHYARSSGDSKWIGMARREVSISWSLMEHILWNHHLDLTAHDKKVIRDIALGRN